MLFYAAPRRATRGINLSVLLIQQIFYKELANQCFDICMHVSSRLTYTIRIQLQVVFMD